jgi:hypothetical protein
VTATPFVMTGTWRGHYVQNGARHGIEMQVVQRGQSFVGAMRDLDTLTTQAFRLVQPAGESGDAVDLGEAESWSTLPERSTIEGEVDGELVRFTKHYQGTARSSLWIPGKFEHHEERPGHRVLYEGTLTADGTTLGGHWHIPAPEPDAPDLRDRFELSRASQ